MRRGLITLFSILVGGFCLLMLASTAEAQSCAWYGCNAWETLGCSDPDPITNCRACTYRCTENPKTCCECGEQDQWSGMECPTDPDPDPCTPADCTSNCGQDRGCGEVCPGPVCGDGFCCNSEKSGHPAFCLEDCGTQCDKQDYNTTTPARSGCFEHSSCNSATNALTGGGP